MPLTLISAAWMILALLIGMLIGSLITRYSLRERLEKAASKEAVKNEFTEFKTQVNDHFLETASLVNQMTQSYKAVYDHLEKGATGLVGEEVLRKQLADVESEPVVLEYIGQKRD